MHLIAFSFEAASDWKPRHLHKNAPHLSVHSAIYEDERCSNHEHLTTYYLVAFFISNKFPRLLAEREIIANAMLYFSTKTVPPPCTQGTRRSDGCLRPLAITEGKDIKKF